MNEEELRSTIIRSLDQGVRFDGREGMIEFRPVALSAEMSSNAEGSARVQIGGTVVLVGVKMMVGTPYPDSPDKGTLMVNTELLPLSNPEFEPGPPRIEAVELSRVVDRCVRESGVIDMGKLCIEPGVKVWSVMVDICTLNDEGNLFDASALGTLIALKTARFPKFDGEKIDFKERAGPLPLHPLPVSVTVLKIGPHYIVDPCYDEWKVYDARLTVATLEDGTICAMQKGGDQPLTLEDVDRMIDIAIDKGKELRKHLNKVK